jgi:hypothetical protein
MNSLSVAVANLPSASLALTAELAEPGTPLPPVVPLLFLFAFLRFLLTTIPTTIPTIAKRTKATPNVFQLSIDFLRGADDRCGLYNLWRLPGRDSSMLPGRYMDWL